MIAPAGVVRRVTVDAVALDQLGEVLPEPVLHPFAALGTHASATVQELWERMHALDSIRTAPDAEIDAVAATMLFWHYTSYPSIDVDALLLRHRDLLLADDEFRASE